MHAEVHRVITMHACPRQTDRQTEEHYGKRANNNTVVVVSVDMTYVCYSDFV